MCAGVLPAAHRKSDEPENEEHGGRDPQEMDGEAGAEEDQHEQQRKNQ
jgi:hypothetical protein